MYRRMFYLTCFALMVALAGSTNAGLADKGTILFEWFNGTTGSDLNQAVDGRNRNYPDNPSEVEYRTVLQGPTTRGDNYMTHVRGYLYPPVTGDYTFWTSSDDHSRLWLSTDADPANKKLIAEVNGYTGALEWTKFPAQKSAPITLQAGQKYYIEVLHRDGTGGDNLAVAWGGPAPIGAGPVLIDGQYLSPFIRAVDYLASTPDPANGAVYMDTWATLGWTAGFAAVTHDVYVSTDSNAVNTGAAIAFAGNQPTNLLLLGLGMPGDPYPAGLVPGTTYYWRVDEVEADGVTKHKGPTWNFFVPPKEAYQPSPVNGAKYQDKAPTLSWSSGLKAKLHVVYFGDSFDAVNNATTGGTSTATIGYTPASPLAEGKTYYWRVDEMDPPATTKGNVWSFTTVPVIAVADPNLAGWWTLDEGEGKRAVDWSGHGVHGAFQGDTAWTDGQDGGAVRFDGSGDYIDTGYTKDLAKWTIACWVNSPAAPANASPSGPLHREKNYQINWNHTGAANRGAIGMRLGGTWYAASYSPVEANTWYHIAATFDGIMLRAYRNGILVTATAAAGTPDAETGTLKFGRHSTAAQYFTGTVDDARVYNRALTAEELLVVMRGDPIRAGNPSPPNGLVSDVARASTLSWLPGTGAVQHAVYFGTDKAAVAGANTSDTTGVYRGLQTAASYTLPAPLAYASGPYYWRVDEQKADGTTVRGTLWSFSVPDYILIDNFEAYNDLPAGQVGSNLVYMTWKDGFANPAGNGATIGYPTGASMQTTTVHSGRQAVPLGYNNTAAPLSEAELALAPQNWTDHGVLTLSLWFYGDPNNVAGQLYVKVNGVKAAYDGEAVNLTRRQWQPWNIDLASVGTNLQSVTSLAIGIEGAGAKGTLLLDDIRLYPYVRQLITPVQPDPNGLTAYYQFEGNANDTAGASNGTLSGGPVFTAGKIGQAIQFDGLDDYVDCGTAPALDIRDAITISCWIKVAAFTKNWEAILAKGDNSYRMSRSATTGNSVHFGCNGPTGGNLDANAIVTDNNWHHVACVYDGVNKIVYIDGREDARVASTGQIALSTNALWIGNNSGSTARQLGGLVDDVRIYSRPLSAAEVAGMAGRTLPVEKAF